jgi:hypothetical protein
VLVPESVKNRDAERHTIAIVGSSGGGIRIALAGEVGIVGESERAELVAAASCCRSTKDA